MRIENRKSGTPGWLPTAASGGAIQGYASAVSARPGERVSLQVSTSPAARYRIVVYRLGWYQGLGARRIACLPGCNVDEPGTSRPVPSPDAQTGKLDAGWPVTDTLSLPSDSISGYFLVEFVLTTGAQAGRASFTYLIVRAPAAARPTNALVQVPVNTWQAYNDWGGKSLTTT